MNKDNTKKKVLFLTYWYPVKEINMGVFVRSHARAIYGNGHDLCLVAINIFYSKKLLKIEKEEVIDSSGYKCFYLNISSVLWKLLYVNLPLLKRLSFFFIKKNLLKTFNPDIIHSNVLYPTAIVGDYVSKKIDKPHVITEHWSQVDRFFSNSVFAKLGRNAYNNAVAITAVSTFLKNNISKYVINQNKIFVIPNVVNPVFEYKPSVKNNDNMISFTIIGKWIPPKNPQLIIDALNIYSEKVDEKILLNIVGAGPLIDNIIKKRNYYKFEIINHGLKSASDIAEILQQTDFFLHCSNMETFSVVIAEALACGVPVVASNIGAIPELINEKNGVVCENTIEEWVNAIAKVTESKYNKADIGMHAKSKFNINAVGEQFNELYDRLL